MPVPRPAAARSCALWLVGAACLAACDPLANIFEPEEPIRPERIYTGKGKAPGGAPGDAVTVMTWNVKFAGGRIDFWFDCFGKRDVMNREEVLGNLGGLVGKIKQVNPDIVLLQEVDVGSFRVAGVDMMQHFVDSTDLGYGVYASHWRSQFLPSNNLRNIDSGNGILSRWPLRDGVRYALPLRTDGSELYRQFYLKRNILQAAVDLPGKGPLTVLDVHTEAYSTDGTKKRHIDAFAAKLAELKARGARFVAGGDLNSVPPGTRTTKGFKDQVCEDPDFPREDYTEEVEWLRGLYTEYDPAIPLQTYAASNDPWFTFTAASPDKGPEKGNFWSRTLDHLFTSGKFVPGSGKVHQSDTMSLSDHAPLVVQYDLTK